MAPIAAATVLNVFLFAWMWRADKAEIRTGKIPWYLSAILISYFAFSGLFMYQSAKYPAGGFPSIFGIALIGEAMGAAITYGLIYAFVTSRGKPFKDRAFAMAASLGLLAVMIGATFSQAVR